jgi:hypothetical protein
MVRVSGYWHKIIVIIVVISCHIREWTLRGHWHKIIAIIVVHTCHLGGGRQHGIGIKSLSSIWSSTITLGVWQTFSFPLDESIAVLLLSHTPAISHEQFAPTHVYGFFYQAIHQHETTCAS